MRFRLLTIAAVLASLAPASAAFAHAHLASASPQPDGTLASSPARVSIEYTEELEPRLSSIRVEDPSGRAVDTGDSQVDAHDARHMSVGLKSLEPGVYKVTWTATATDTHKTHGTYTFTVTR